MRAEVRVGVDTRAGDPKVDSRPGEKARGCSKVRFLGRQV